MRRKYSHLKKIPQAALAAVLSLHLALPQKTVADVVPGTILTGTHSITSADADSNGIIDGNSSTGYFVSSGTLNISDVTLQNFSTHGGDGSGGGAGMGGALFINTGATVTLNNVNFLSNTVQGGNGGVGQYGGSLNNLFNNGAAAASGSNGYTPPYDMLADINGANGSRGGNGTSSAVGFGGAGGNGSDGTHGGSSNPLLLAAVVAATIDLTAGTTETAADAANPLTANVAAGDAAEVAVKVINLASAITAVVTFDTALAAGQIGYGGTAGSGGQGGNSAFGFGGAPGGSGGDGGAGGQPGVGSLLAGVGGAAGGDAGNGGSGGMGGFGAGGGAGGAGGTGGAGASWGLPSALLPVSGNQGSVSTTPAYYDQVQRHVGEDDQGNPVQNTDPQGANYNTTASFYTERTVNGTYHPAVTTVSDPTPSFSGWSELSGSRPDGLDGSGGSGGVGGFGGGAGAGGSGYNTVAGGGSGGSGFGGAIFVRSGATLHITGDALFDGNGARGGQGQAASGANTTDGVSGIGVGTDIFLMTGGTLLLDPGAGHTITFNGNPYNTSIADDSASSIIPSGGTSKIPSGAGADVHIMSGLVQFNGANVYSGQTIIQGGTLQATDGSGIYWDSNINLAGTTTSDAVLMADGTEGSITRFVGTQSNRLQWTGSGGFAAVNGDLTVNLSNGQTMKWAANSFVPNNNALVFGSVYATNKVLFNNNINLNNDNRTILVVANDATLSGTTANVDYAVLSGVISNGSLTLGDATHKGTVVLTGANTYTGATTVNGGGLALASAGSLVNTMALTLANGTSFDISGLIATGQTLASLTAGTSTTVSLGAKNLTVGDSSSTTVAGVISDGGIYGGTSGSLTKQGSGTLTLTAVNTYSGGTTISAGTLALTGSGSLAAASAMNITGAGGTFDISGINASGETIGSIAGVSGSKAVLGSKNLTAGGSSDTTMAGVISGSGGSFTKTGSGKLTLTAANTYTGATTVAAGTLALSGAGSLADSTAVSLTDASSKLDISAISAGSETVASLASVAGSSVVLGAKNLTAGDSNNTTVAGSLSGTGGSFTKTGSGTMTFTGANTYTGATTISDGTLALSAGGSLSDSSAVNLSSAMGVLDISGITADGETIASIAGVTGSQVFLGAKNLTAGNDGDTTMAGVISDGGIVAGTGGSLTKQGKGKLTLSGANTYTGDTTVNAGTLATSGNERIANASDLIVASGATFLLGGNETLSSISGAGSINLQSNTLATYSNVDSTFSGVISGTDESILSKTGTGKLTLSGDNTYTGITNFNGGSVDLTGSLASKEVNIASGVTLDSKAGGLSAMAAISNDGTINLGSTDDTVKSYTSTGTLNGPGKLNALNYNLNDGSVVNTSLGSGTLTTNGTVNLYGSSAAETVVVNAESVLNLKAPELILNSATVTVNGTLNLDYTPGGTETFQTLLGSGTIHTNGNALIVADGGNFTGILDAPDTNLTVGSSGGSGGSFTLGSGTTTTQSTEIDNGLTIGSGATLNSTTITIANGSVLDLSGGGTITFTTLTSLDKTGGVINIGSNDFVLPVGSTIAGNITFIGTGKVIILGTLSPGFSPGVTDLTGAGPAPTLGGVFNAQLAGLGGVGGTDFDQVRIAPGATLTIGGTLNVQGFGGFVPKQGDAFQIISGPLGTVPILPLAGTFTTVTFDPTGSGPVNANSAGFVLDVNTGLLTTTGLNSSTNTFADLGATDNQRGAAAAIFNAAFVGQNQIDSSKTAGQLALQIIDAAGGSSADLAKYTPEYYGSLADYAFMGNQVLVRSIQDRVSPMNYIPAEIGEDSLSQVPETMSVFMGYTYANLNTPDSAKATRNDYYAGMNLLASEDYVFGIAGSMSQGSIRASLGSASSEGWGAMVFGRYVVAKSFTFFGSFGFNQQSMDLKRQTVNGTVTGSTDVTSYVGFLGVQYKGWRVGGVSIAPRVSLSYSNSRVGGFNETGAIDALNVGGYHNNRFMAEAGVSALWSTELAGRGVNLEVSLSVQQYLQNTKSQMAVNVASVPSASYGVNFASTGNTQAVAQVNASYAIAKAVTAYVGYEGHFGNQSMQYAKAGIRVNF
ncbi:autotransporter-associated beta strand repeat-containing protein [Prosthecobacter sp.]|uniref:autotransporter-associated beta strand repeat-containing protein n=1 Tax=Prosthecobacter sp. TaxID=1965333 RepID=UPI0037831EBF